MARFRIGALSMSVDKGQSSTIRFCMAAFSYINGGAVLSGFVCMHNRTVSGGAVLYRFINVVEMPPLKVLQGPYFLVLKYLQKYLESNGRAVLCNIYHAVKKLKSNGKRSASKQAGAPPPFRRFSFWKVLGVTRGRRGRGSSQADRRRQCGRCGRRRRRRRRRIQPSGPRSEDDDEGGAGRREQRLRKQQLGRVCGRGGEGGHRC